MELETDNCRNLTIFLEVVVYIVASLLTHRVMEVEETKEVRETKRKSFLHRTPMVEVSSMQPRLWVRSYGRPFYYLMVNSWYVQIEFTIYTYHEFNSWIQCTYHEFELTICTYHEFKFMISRTNSIHDITNWIRDMYISWIQFEHITNSPLNSKTASHTTGRRTWLELRRRSAYRLSELVRRKSILVWD